MKMKALKAAVIRFDEQDVIVTSGSPHTALTHWTVQNYYSMPGVDMPCATGLTLSSYTYDGTGWAAGEQKVYYDNAEQVKKYQELMEFGATTGSWIAGTSDVSTWHLCAEDHPISGQ